MPGMVGASVVKVDDVVLAPIIREILQQLTTSAVSPPACSPRALLMSSLFR